MHTVPGAMIWELYSRGKWLLLGAMLVANAIPILLLSALAREGEVDPEDSSQVIMHVVMTQMNVMIFGMAILGVQGTPQRLFVAPLRTSTLVIWRMLPAMVLMFMETALSTWMLNELYGVNWPIWGPSLFCATAIAAVMAGLWQADKSAWIPVILGSIATALGIWYKSRHGATFSMPQHYWRQVTLSEVLVMAASVYVSYIAACQGLARMRRGEILRSFGIMAFLERLIDPPSELGPPFRSPEAAQYWFFYRQKWWAMPATVVFGLVVGVGGWAIVDRQPAELLQGLIIGGGLLSQAAVVGGLVLGNCGPSDQNFEMGNFLATRPLSTRSLSNTVLELSFKSVLWSWLIWGTVTGVTCLSFLLLGIPLAMPPESVKLQAVFESGGWWWYVALTILGPWTVLSLTAAMGLTGRALLIPAVTCLLVGGFVLVEMIEQLWLTEDAQLVLSRVLIVTVTGAAIGATYIAYLLARRKGLIEPPQGRTAVAFWCLSVVVLAIASLRPGGLPVFTALLCTGLTALAVAPFSVIPLALAWNRVR